MQNDLLCCAPSTGRKLEKGPVCERMWVSGIDYALQAAIEAAN